MSQQEANEIGLTIKEAKAKVDLAASLERLDRNRDFKKIVLEGYMKDEAIRLAHLKSEPAMQNERAQAAIDYAIHSVGNFNQYLEKISREGEAAAEAIKENEELLAEMNAEGVDA